MLDLTGVTLSLLLLSFFAILLNTFCLHVIRIRKSFRSKPSTLFLINLLLTHLVQAILVLPMYVGKSFKPDQVFAKRLFKNGFLFTYLLSFYGVCFGVLLISFDRFLATYLLNKYKIYVTSRNALWGIIVSWLYIFILCLIPFAPRQDAASKILNRYKNYLRYYLIMIFLSLAFPFEIETIIRFVYIFLTLIFYLFVLINALVRP